MILISAVTLYVVTISVFTYGLLWRQWLLVAGSVIPGAATVVLAIMSSALWLPAFSGIGGINSNGSIAAVVCLLMMSWLAAVVVLTRDGVDGLMMGLLDRVQALPQGLRRGGRS